MRGTYYVSIQYFILPLMGITIVTEMARILFMTELSQVSFFLFALFIVITMVGISFIGIHQVVVTVLATQMDPVLLGTSKEILALLLMLARSAVRDNKLY